MTWTSTVTQAAQSTTCFQSKCHLVKSTVEAKAANALVSSMKRHTEWFRLDPSLFARKSWVLKAWTPSVPSGLQGSKAHRCPESVVRGFVPQTFLNMEKKPRPSSYPSKIVINPVPSSHFPHLILLHFSYFLWVHGTLMVKVTLKSSKKRPND